jgi:hypothetical protein
VLNVKSLVGAMAFTPDGEVLAATAKKSGTLKLWDIRGLCAAAKTL